MTADEAVSGLRAILGVGGWPEERHHWQLIAYLMQEERIDVEIRPIRKSYHVTVDGCRRIRIAERLTEREKGRKALEEAGHAVLGGTRPVYPPAGRICERRRARLVRSASQRQESVARWFMLAWLLPLPLILPYQGRLEALARDSGCSLAEVRERWEMLERR